MTLSNRSNALARRQERAEAQGLTTIKPFAFVVPPSYPARIIVPVMWLLALATFPVWIHFDVPAWDFQIYGTALHALLAGHDPYADAIAIQQLFHRELALHPNANVPYSYVYSPLTLPLLRLIGTMPVWLSVSLYWIAYALGVATQTWFGTRAIATKEYWYLVYLAPVAMFFPGLLACDNVMSGNIAYILYGLVLAGAVLGWRRDTWRWFYLAVLAASCVKAPMLSLVVIPVLSARRQWFSASATALLGLALFAVQPVVWPRLFHHYLQAVELQFSYNRDFGVSPAGLFSGVLFDHGIPYSPASFIFYLAYAIPLFGLLLYLSRRFLAGSFTLIQWLPVLTLGVILLNPRLIEYDLAPLALPLALIGFRFFSQFCSPGRAVISLALVFAALNAVAMRSWNIWKLTDGPLLVVFLAAGVWTLLQQPGELTDMAG